MERNHISFYIDGDFGPNQVVPTPKPYWKANIEHSVDSSLQWLVDAKILPHIQLEDIAHLGWNWLFAWVCMSIFQSVA